jgi:hypothetical protein
VYCRHRCKYGKKHRDPCMVCKAEAICTKTNMITGQMEQVFRRKYKKEHKASFSHLSLHSCLLLVYPA